MNAIELPSFETTESYWTERNCLALINSIASLLRYNSASQVAVIDAAERIYILSSRSPYYIQENVDIVFKGHKFARSCTCPPTAQTHTSTCPLNPPSPQEIYRSLL